MEDLTPDLQPASVLLAGDFMLDVYRFGSVHRISPEAPVPIVHFEREESRPGGAGNAALNLLSLGMKVSLLGRVGKDEGGKTLFQLLKKEGASLENLSEDPLHTTPVKTRIIADQQQLLRIDQENPLPLSKEAEEKILASLSDIVSKVKIIAVSDYGKGFLTPTILKSLICEANKQNVPIVVDPKGTNFKKYEGATLIKPNFAEAMAASGLTKETSIDSIAEKILQETQIEHLMITRSKEGISIFSKSGGRQDFKADVKQVIDVTGAGDTVLAVVTASLANHRSIAFAAQLANKAAGIAVQQLGCARITLAELRKRVAHDYTIV